MRLKPFKPDKELKKSNRKYSKKQLISTLLVLAVLITIGTSHAIFSIQPEYYTFIKSQVGEFSTSDIKLFVTVEGEKLDEFPAKDSGYVYEKVTCKNGGTGTWDADNWQIKLSVAGPDECTINFEKYVAPASEYVESLLASNPETMNNDDPDGNVRYMGANPNNYVWFNDELWRIIGVFDVKSSEDSEPEKRIKLVRNAPIGGYSWDSSDENTMDGYGINDWSQADLMHLLNDGAYWNRTSGTCYIGRYNESQPCDFSKNGLTETSKSYIENALYYTGSGHDDSSDAYSTIAEVYYNNEKRETWIGSVGLLYPSDFGYAVSGTGNYSRNQCLSESLRNINVECRNSNWLYIYSSNLVIFTINKSPGNVSGVITFSGGELGAGVPYAAIRYTAVPVVYLKSNVKIINGDGTSVNPYQLGL